MVYFWNSFLGNTVFEEEDCFNWTNCKKCGIYSTNVSIKEHQELLCPKRIISCIYKATGCPYRSEADIMMAHQAMCEYRPGYNVIKCESCGDPIHQPKFQREKSFENQKICIHCRTEVKSRPNSLMVRRNYTDQVELGSDEHEAASNHEEMACMRHNWKVMNFRRESTYDFLRW